VPFDNKIQKEYKKNRTNSTVFIRENENQYEAVEIPGEQKSAASKCLTLSCVR